MNNMRCETCRFGVPNFAGTGCNKKCRENEVENGFGGCSRCPYAKVPHDGVCKICPVGKYTRENEYCESCPHFYKVDENQKGCTPCGKSQMVSPNKMDCVCPKGFVGFPNCVPCKGNMIASGIFDKQSFCIGCPDGMEPDLHHTNCFAPNNATFLLSQWKIWGCLLAILTLSGVLIKICHCQKKWPVVVDPQEQEQHDHKFLKSKFWAACCCGFMQPRAWSWKVLAAADVFDWLMYVLWFLTSKTKVGMAAEFQSDQAVLLFCSFIIVFGLILPFLMFIFPRPAYLFIEMLYDTVEFLSVLYCSFAYSFNNQTIGFAVLNALVTAGDVFIIKGPEFLDILLVCVGCVVDRQLQRSALRADVPINQGVLQLTIEHLTLFKVGDGIQITEDAQHSHKVTHLLPAQGSIVITPPTRQAFKTGDGVLLKNRDGKAVDLQTGFQRTKSDAMRGSMEASCCLCCGNGGWRNLGVEDSDSDEEILDLSGDASSLSS
mmetsp:Transcript_109422/g.189310  ORF Transcript_109422/g.189310 Transcript_109422/m.189310 type:complete len:489 (+) Transcript_109422:2-1468(+)